MLRVRSLAVLGIAMAIALSFASCGGGGGAMGGPGPAPSPSVCPSPNNSYPPNDCTTYTLSGTSKQTLTRFVPTPTPPPLVTNSVITENAVVHTNQVFHSTTASDFKTTETDAGPNQTITTNSDIYLVFPASTGNVLNIGFHSTDSNGVALDVQYLGGNGIVGHVPLTGGWTNTAASVIAETDPDGTTDTQNINADGSYTETKTEVAGSTTVTQKSDGTGNATVPASFFVGFATSQITVGPVIGGFIAYTISAVGPLPTPTPIVLNVPAWYLPSPTLASDTTTNMNTTTIPGGCTAAAFGTTGTQLHEVKSRLDTIFGIMDSETIDTWVSATAGPVCEQISDTQSLHYDFTGQSNPIIPSSTPVQTTSLSELIGLQTVTRSDGVRHPSNLRSSTSSLAPQMEISRERIERFRQAFRARQLRSLRDFLKRGILK